MNSILQNIVRFIFLVLLQVLILNNIHLSGYINPFLYIAFILLLPFNTPHWLVLILAFTIGITIDMFSNTGGIHSFATVLTGFMRPPILRFVSPRDGYDIIQQPTLQQFGFNWFLSYTGILVLVHHMTLFYLEAFHFKYFFSTFFRALLSGIFTLLLLFVSQFFFSKPRAK